MKRSNEIPPNGIPIVAGILAVALSWFLFHAIIWATAGSVIDAGRLVGPDSYMRLVRVEELLNGTGWFNDVIARANAPYGDQLHWTRPFDVLLITVATPLAPFLGWKAAIYWAGALTAPFLQIITALLFGWAIFPFMRTKLWFLPAIAVFLQPAAAAAGLTGRADHHALFLLVFVAQFGFLLRALHNRHDHESAMWLGVLIGFGLWLSVEFLLNFALLAGTLGVAWLYDPKGRVEQNRHFALSGFAIVLIAVVLEHGIVLPSAVFFDEISLPHLLLVGLLAAFWLIVSEFHKSRIEIGLVGRLFVTAIGGLATVGVMFAVFPKFFQGPMVDIDPRIVPIWLDWVLEMKDILPRDRETLGKVIIYLGHAAIALPYLVWRIRREESAPGRLIWFAILLATLAYGLVALFHIRFSSYAQIAFIFALAGFIDSTFLAAAPIKSDISRGLVRGCAIALIFVGPIITGKVISNAGFENFADPGKVKTASEICEMPKLAGYLNDETIFPDSEVVLAFLDLGPQILYYTRHQIIGAPYHRNGEGILASHEIFSTNDTEKARSMMAERGVGLILLCPNSPEQNFYTATNGAEALYGRLSANDPPDWIEPLPLPDELRDGFKLFRLRL